MIGEFADWNILALAMRKIEKNILIMIGEKKYLLMNGKRKNGHRCTRIRRLCIFRMEVI